MGIAFQQWRLLTPVLAFGGLFAGLQMGRPSWLDEPVRRPSAPVSRAAVSSPKSAPVPVSEPIVGFLDMPDGKPVLFAKESSRVPVSGWTACSVAGSTLTRVAILVDGEERAEVTSFFSRPDVAAAFGRPEFEMSGWKTAVPLAGLKPGEHTLSAHGFGSHGEKGILPPFRLNVLE